MPLWAHQFEHGVGDAVQFACLLRHLRHYYPEVQHHVALRPGCGPAVADVAERITRDLPPLDGYERGLRHDWSTPWVFYGDAPSTKLVCCLREVFKREPIPALLHYRIAVRAEILERARRTVEAFGPYLTIHYQGNTCHEAKDLPHETARAVCHAAREQGCGVLLFDWDNRSSLPYEKLAWCLDARHPLWDGLGTGNAEMIAALMSLARCNVAIDSGPGKIAAAVADAGGPPCLTAWRRHHPVNYCDLADQVRHLVPADHEHCLHGLGDRTAALRYFTEHYLHGVYATEADLRELLCREVVAALTSSPPVSLEPSLVFQENHWLRRNLLGQDQAIVQDVYRSDCYRVGQIRSPVEYVVDVGACLGSFARKVHEQFPRARILACECCPENLEILNRNVGDFATVVPAAVTYEQNVALLNSVYPGCASTGGSAVVPWQDAERWRAGGRERQPGFSLPGGSPIGYRDGHKREYWADFRPLETITLEGLCQRYGFPRIDILKLDCEGSEFSILAGLTMHQDLRCIVGEWHAPEEEFRALVARHFQGWELDVWRGGFYGLFRLHNPGAKGFFQP